MPNDNPILTEQLLKKTEYIYTRLAYFITRAAELEREIKPPYINKTIRKLKGDK